MTDNPEQSIASTGERLADEVLEGGPAIADHIRTLGFKITTDGVYYAHKTKKWPITKFGKNLFTTKSKIERHARKILGGA
jgi:hypothetical protein